MAKQTKAQKEEEAAKKAAEQAFQQQPEPPLTTGSDPASVIENQTETFIAQNPETQPPVDPQEAEAPVVEKTEEVQTPPVSDTETPKAKESRNTVAIVLENAVTPQMIGENEFVVGLDRRLAIGKKIKADDDSHEFNVVFVGAGRFKEDDPGTAVFDHMIQQSKYKKDLKKDKVLQVGTKFRIVD